MKAIQGLPDQCGYYWKLDGGGKEIVLVEIVDNDEIEGPQTNLRYADEQDVFDVDAGITWDVFSGDIFLGPLVQPDISRFKVKQSKEDREWDRDTKNFSLGACAGTKEFFGKPLDRKDFYTVWELSLRLHRSHNIPYMIKKGELPAIKVPNDNRWFIPKIADKVINLMDWDRELAIDDCDCDHSCSLCNPDSFYE